MGQKTNPIGFRLGIIKSWNSRWYASNKKFSDLVHEDMLIKRYINKRLDNAGIAKVIISRAPKKVTVDVHTSRPGIVIGRKGAEVDKLRGELQLLTKNDILLNIVEVRKPELDAQLVADSIARQLVGRVSFRRAMKKSIAATMKMGAVGIKVQCSGRLGGAEIAREEKYKEGRIPLHTLRADIDYATSTAHTTYGCIGVKVWICRGEILETGNFYESAKDRQDAAQDVVPSRSRRGQTDERRSKRPRGRIRRKKDYRGKDEKATPPRGRRPDRNTRTENVQRASKANDGAKKQNFQGKPEKKQQPQAKATKQPKEKALGKQNNTKSDSSGSSGKSEA